jgi:cytochrome P450
MDAIATAEREKSAIGFDPLSPEYLANPYPFLAAAAAAAPAFYCESIDHWVVTRYHDIRHIFRTPALFSAANANSPLRPPCPMAAKALQEGGFKSVPTLANVDPPPTPVCERSPTSLSRPSALRKWSRSFAI